MAKQLIRNLKTLFHNWIYYRVEDETNYHNWINEYTGYINGGFNITQGLPVTVNQSFGDVDVNIYDNLFHFIITVPEGLNENQKFLMNNASIGSCTLSSNDKTIDVTFTRTNNSTPVFILEPYTTEDYYYTGFNVPLNMNI